MNLSWTPQMLFSFLLLASIFWIAIKIGSVFIKLAMSFLGFWYFWTVTLPTLQVFLGFIKPSQIESITTKLIEIKDVILNFIS